MEREETSSEPLWEVAAPGFPPLSRPAVGLGSLLLAAAVLSARAEAAVHPLLGWRVPLLLPLVAALVALATFWVARWRSTTWTLTRAGLVRARGVLLRRAAAPIPPAELAPGAFAGLDPASIDALIEATRAGAPPSRELTARDAARPLALLLLLTAAWIGAAEAFLWRHRVERAAFLRTTAAVGEALARAREQLEPALAAEAARRIEQDEALSTLMRNQALEPPLIAGGTVSYLLLDAALLAGSSLELRFELRAPRVTRTTLSVGGGGELRTGLTLRVERPAWLPWPAGPVEITPSGAPDDERSLQVLLPLLEAAGVAYELRSPD